MKPQFPTKTNPEPCRAAVEAERPESCATLFVPSRAFSHPRSDGAAPEAAGHDGGGGVDASDGDVAVAEMNLRNYCCPADLRVET